MKKWFVLIFLAFYLCSPAHAAEIRKQDGSIRVSGAIEVGDDRALQQIFIDHPVNAGDEVEIVLNSPGGRPFTAYNMFHFLRWLSSKGVHIVTHLPYRHDCASACVMVFSAGDERKAHSSSILTFHAAYWEDEATESIRAEGRKVYLETLKHADPSFHDMVVERKWIDDGQTDLFAKEIEALAPGFLELAP